MHEMESARMLSRECWIHMDVMIVDFKLTKPK